MSSLFQRGSVFYLSWKDASGKWRKRSVGKDAAKAQAALAKAETSSPTFGFGLARVLEDYLARLSIYGKRSSHHHASCAGRAVLRILGDLEVSTLSSARVDQFILARRREGVADSTLNGDLRILLAALRLAQSEGRIPALPCRIRLLRLTKKLPKVLSTQQVERLLEVSGNLRGLLLTALHTGFRAQELASLDWSDVDFDRRRISVTSKPALGFSPKAHVERSVPLSERLGLALKDHREGGPHRPSDPVFQMAPGVRWTAQIHRAVRRVFEKAGLYNRANKSGLHQLRRTFATTLLDAGVSVEAVRQLGGWASISIVQAYATTADKTKQEAVEKLPW